MPYINAIASIGFQNLLLGNESLSQLQIINQNTRLIQPNYKQWIKPMQLRRMSKIVRMGLGCTQQIVEQIPLQNFDSIIVGTGLGCVKDTLKFLETINKVSVTSIPPTAFIQSTHNTIAGQIALHLGNHQYNMTYVQNNLSFEQALLDATLHINEGKNNVLVGGLDEMIPHLQDLLQQANISQPHTYTEGSAFFNLSHSAENSFAKIKKTMTYHYADDFNLNQIIENFLAEANISHQTIDLVLENSPKFDIPHQQTALFNHKIAYEKYCGKYFTSSAFAVYLTCKIFQEKLETINKTFKLQLPKVNTILIVNQYLNQSVGLCLLER